MQPVLKTLVLSSLLFASALALEVDGKFTVILPNDQFDKNHLKFAGSAQDADIRRFSNIPVAGGYLSTGVTAKTNSNAGGTSAKVDSVVYISRAGVGASAPSLDWSYSSTQVSATPGNFDASNTAVYTSFRPLAIVNYVDANGNNVFDDGEQTKVTATTTFSLTASLTSSTSADGVYIITLNSPGNAFGFRYTVAGKPINNQGVLVKEDSMKIDIWMTPSYAANATDNTRVALVTTLSARQISASLSGAVSRGNDNNVTVNGASNLKFTNEGVSSGFSWASSADVLDNNNSPTTANVRSSVLALKAGASFRLGSNSFDHKDITVGDVAKVMVFNFDADKPKEIYWDPTFGSSSDASTLAMSVFLLVVVSLLL